MPRHLYRTCSLKCAPESVPLVIAVLGRFGFIVGAQPATAGVSYKIDLSHSILRRGDAQCAELMVKRWIETAVSLHDTPEGCPPDGMDHDGAA